jgi:tRNA pseudouridine32 synthase/23S rRNA pseudouridine746 synthase
MAPEKQEIHLEITEAAEKSSQVLADASGLSLQQIKQAMQAGAVWLERAGNIKRLRRAKKALQLGDVLHFYYDEKIIKQSIRPAQLIEDCGEYSVWFKPSGMFSQGSKWGDANTIYRFSEMHLQPERPAFLVHRLDRATSGLILLAHSKKMAAILSAMFAERAIEKKYQAIVAGDCRAWRQGKTLNGNVNGKKAVSHVSFIAFNKAKQQSLVSVAIETGRKHQIRQHLSASGHPIIADRLYGGGDGSELDLQLIAYRLAFTCPINGELKQYQLSDDLLLSP